MPAEMWTFAGGVAAAIASVIGGMLVHRSSRLASKASPYDALSARVVKLETQVGELRASVEHLEDERDDLRDLIREMWRFIREHVPADVVRPFLIPPWLDATR